MFNKYDVIVVGAGHAGCEAAHAAAAMGCSTLLITMNMNTIAHMSCNPAMGGVAKGQIVREIDALGGMSGIITDKSAIQFRLLNRSKGPAMWSPRTQNDRLRFAEEWRLALEATPNLDMWQEMVSEILVEGDQVVGVKTQLGIEIKATSVILTNGTFLNGLIHIGEKQFGGGRAGERAATGITAQLESLGFTSGRMKTGTPPRVDGRSLNWDKMTEQPGDENPGKFSYSSTTQPLTEQRSCYITYTNPTVHEILESGFERSPMFNGRIQGLGPRYCPSIEDKINRFAERDRHQIFVEPEGWNTVEIYVNGFSTSLPEDIQLKAMKEIVGFENVKMFRPGYAIEYDFFHPTQLETTLETQLVKNLYFAGQINGTTGYEEAGCQGLMAGINAALRSQGKDPFVLNRSEAYIGVLIDDLINKGTDEPYRMFTSRAEFRILLRQDNADLRLTGKGYELGLASEERYLNMQEKEAKLQDIENTLASISVAPERANPILEASGTSALKEKTTLAKLIKRPQIHLEAFRGMSEEWTDKAASLETDILEAAEIAIKYEDYITREQELVNKMEALENHKIRTDFDYLRVKGLSSEAREKLIKQKPQTVGQASRISGISPADISILLVYLGK